MRVFAGITIAVFGVLAAATPAIAQVSQPAPDQTRFATTETGTTSQPPRQNSIPIEFRGQIGGVFRSGEAGFILGGAVGARPFNNRQVEVAGDISFLRFGGGNGLYWSGNGLYHFKTNEPNFKPYAGAGIGLVSISDDTEARFQILGGVEIRPSAKHPIRPELRIIFTEHDVTTVLMLSIGLAKR